MSSIGAKYRRILWFYGSHDAISYEMLFQGAPKSWYVSLIYRTEPITENGEKEKKIKK